MKRRVTSRKDFSSLRIYIKGQLHLHFSLEDFLGLQSWLWTVPQATYTRGREGEPSFDIELYFVHGKPIHVTYNDRGLWKEVLRELDTNL